MNINKIQRFFLEEHQTLVVLVIIITFLALSVIIDLVDICLKKRNY
jgi:hypothetical protein